MIDGAIKPIFDDTEELLGRGSRTVRLRLMVTGGGGHNVYPGSGPLYGGNTLLPP